MSSDYEPLEVIGKGSYGTVRKVRNKLDNSILVRKEIEYKSMNSQERNQIISELRILKELNHRNIVRYYKHDHIINSKTIHIYMEYCSGGDLSQLIKDFKTIKKMYPRSLYGKSWYKPCQHCIDAIMDQTLQKWTCSIALRMMVSICLRSTQIQ